MTWENMFSYGTDNSIDFQNAKLLQILGKNGHGKSSIGLVLEEVLYNKNAKGIKRADIVNRYSDSGKYKCTLTFTKGNDSYYIESIRGSTQTVRLLKNGENISAHTPTGTYKILEDIIGIDHETFTQIVNESSAFSLKFLTATDTARKKFLIDLFKLGKYTDILNKLTEVHKSANIELKNTLSNITTLNRLLDKHRSTNLSPMRLVDVPEDPIELKQQLYNLKAELEHLDQFNQRVAKNNLLLTKIKSINIDESYPFTPNEYAQFEQEVSSLNAAIVLDDAEIKSLKAIIAGTDVSTICKACKRPLDVSHKLEQVKHAKETLPVVEANRVAKLEERKELSSILALAKKIEADRLEFERLTALVDNSLPAVFKSGTEIQCNIDAVSNDIKDIKTKIAEAVAHNTKAYAHNASIDVASKLIKETELEIANAVEKQLELGSQISKLAILVKAFSPSGLVAYKLECLTKDLENSVNEYLAELSDGRFTLTFRIAESDKLNIVISDNGREVDILSLSSGERARVNICTLLALRKLMQTITSTRLNLLILDETIDHLDEEGKEKLVEVLSKEIDLNTILISHGFSHPLLEKITVVKRNKISRIENG